MYTSRKSNGFESFHVITQSKKQKLGFSRKNKNNNKAEMQAICFKDEQAKVHLSQHGRHKAKLMTRASLTKNNMYTGTLVNIFNG